MTSFTFTATAWLEVHSKAHRNFFEESQFVATELFSYIPPAALTLKHSSKQTNPKRTCTLHALEIPCSFPAGQYSIEQIMKTLNWSCRNVLSQQFVKNIFLKKC